MLDNFLFVDARERLRHLRYIEIIAEELSRPVEEVASLYEDVLMQLSKQAVIHDYLAIFTSKKVKLLFSKLLNGGVAN